MVSSIAFIVHLCGSRRGQDIQYRFVSDNEVQSLYHKKARFVHLASLRRFIIDSNMNISNKKNVTTMSASHLIGKVGGFDESNLQNSHFDPGVFLFVYWLVCSFVFSILCRKNGEANFLEEMHDFRFCMPRQCLRSFFIRASELKDR